MKEVSDLPNGEGRIPRESSVSEPTVEKHERMTPFQKLSLDLSNDQKCLKEITLGKRIGFYRIRGELGSGNFSQVKMGIHALTKEKVAIKILDKTKLDQKTQRLLSREISSMEKLHHPNIIRLYEVLETLAKLHIVMEYAGGGELFTKISNEGKMPEQEAKHIFAQVIAGVEHMHKHNIIHRDLKAENIFYNGPKSVKIGDFGFSTISKVDQTLNTFCGSPPYAAPELFKDESYGGVYVDIWALGIMLYFMITGVMPFRADTVAKLKKCILEGNYIIPSYISDSGQFLIRSIMKPVPHDRFSIREIRNSDWLDGQDFPEALQPYNLLPGSDTSTLSTDEKEARVMLQDLGIGEEHLKGTGHRDSRSTITGTYRILLHRVQKKNSGVDDTGIESFGRTDDGGNSNRDRYQAKPKQESKLCVIL
ncbi:serine/threonine-protein kinase NIM1-like [Pecten maximus]|uniref:serine/threonine-protein kinase NIM1-like n=1 Tax=Pecten maximus TaxID=6579 RepID=UPI001459097E|nr:serine/threonine-protein kinase NIM1-like [Pecten maximus]